jgi:hypothetical protein
VYPFWDLAILPILQASGARRIVEIGALKGDTTVRMLEGLGPDVELHVIDPLPAFDPAEHERRFAGRYLFHRDLSLNVLDGLPPMDVALVDGDHNWYTVYHELTALRDVARRESRPMPVLVLHDVGWPYGRRDLYYAPEQIPDEHRQPYARRGIVRGSEELVESGGANSENCNAIREGGPRNGVMTALDDFVAEHDRPVRVVVLPVYHGLAIAAEAEVLTAHPELAELLDRLEGADGQGALAELAETQRIELVVEYHNVFYGTKARIAALTREQLDVLQAVADAERSLIGAEAEAMPLAEVEQLLDEMRSAGAFGHLVVCGRGAAADAVFLRGYLNVHQLGFRLAVAVDPGGAVSEAEAAFSRPPLVDGRVRRLSGPYERAVADVPGPIAFLWIAAAAAADVTHILDALYERLADGAVVVVSRSADAEVAASVDDVLRRRGVTVDRARTDSGSSWWRHVASSTVEPEVVVSR